MSQVAREVFPIENKHALAVFRALDVQNLQTLKTALEKLTPNEFKITLSERNNFGEDALMFAARRGFLYGLDALLEQSHIVDSSIASHRDKSGNTALLAACKAPASALSEVVERLLRASWNIYDSNYANLNALNMVLQRYQAARTESERNACLNAMRILADYGALIAQRWGLELADLFKDMPAMPCFGASFAYKTAKEAVPNAYFAKEHLDAWVLALERLRHDGLHSAQAESAEAKLRNLQRARMIYWQSVRSPEGMRFFKAAARTEETLYLQKVHVQVALPDENALLDNHEYPVPLQRACKNVSSLLSQCYRESPPIRRFQYLLQQYSALYYLFAWLVLVGAGAGLAIAMHSLLDSTVRDDNEQTHRTVMIAAPSTGLAVFGFIWLAVKWLYERSLAAEERRLLERFTEARREISADLGMLKDCNDQTLPAREVQAAKTKSETAKSLSDLESLVTILGRLACRASQASQAPEIDNEGLETISLL